MAAIVAWIGDVFQNTKGKRPTWPLPNVQLGVSTETQEWADKRIPFLLKTSAAIRFLSVEPFLGPVDLLPYLPIFPLRMPKENMPPSVDWVIVGGESGGPPERALVRRGSEGRNSALSGMMPKSEAIEWVRSLRNQCIHAGVPFFFKQWGGPTPKSGGRLLDDKEWSEFP
jgi:protein gp37